MPAVPSFDDYVASLGRLTAHVDPTAASPQAAAIKEAVESLRALPDLSATTVAEWAHEHPTWVITLGLAVGLSQEKLKNTLRHLFNTSSWAVVARTRSADLIRTLDEDYDLLRLLRVQFKRSYDFSDVLIARAGSRATARRAGASGRRIEDEIEAVARDLGLPCSTRTRFTGRNNRTAPCDLAVPNAADAAIVVAAKGFDSTGSKLTDAVREIHEMADVRLPSQYVMAVIDGIGWKNRMSDLRRIFSLWESNQINGMYTLASLDRFREDLEEAARLRGIATT